MLPIRYGLGGYLIKRRLELLAQCLNRWDLTPTIPTTAVVLERHPEVKKAMNSFDLAVHGFRHVAYDRLSPAEQTRDIDAALAVFRKMELPIRGFRAPYLRPNGSTRGILAERRFLFDSSGARFELPDSHPVTSSAIALTHTRYGSRAGHDKIELLGANLVEIPVSLPDDEILTDGLLISQPSALWSVYRAMLDNVRATGRLLVLQVHPERFHLLEGTVRQILVRAADDSAWMASLSEIAAWVHTTRGAARWPNGSPYAVAVTGDLDAVTMGDFAFRLIGA